MNKEVQFKILQKDKSILPPQCLGRKIKIKKQIKEKVY